MSPSAVAHSSRDSLRGEQKKDAAVQKTLANVNVSGSHMSGKHKEGKKRRIAALTHRKRKSNNKPESRSNQTDTVQPTHDPIVVHNAISSQEHHQVESASHSKTYEAEACCPKCKFYEGEMRRTMAHSLKLMLEHRKLKEALQFPERSVERLSKKDMSGLQAAPQPPAAVSMICTQTRVEPMERVARGHGSRDPPQDRHRHE